MLITQFLTRASAVVAATLAAVLLSSPVAQADDLGGTWTKKSQSIQGGWSIVETDEGRFLELDDAFKTRRAPDLKLFLSPLPADQVEARNATAGSVLIAKLETAKGAQRYRLPNDLSLDDYETLVLHGEKYSKLWGVSAL